MKVTQFFFLTGDIFQGTPYFNIYGGEVEFKLMSQMGYDAATIGNHDFDNGIDGLVKQLNHANFHLLYLIMILLILLWMVNILNIKYSIKEELRLEFLVLESNLKDLFQKVCIKTLCIKILLKKANYYSDYLKNKLSCDLVICLSHLGLKYNSKRYQIIFYQNQNTLI